MAGLKDDKWRLDTASYATRLVIPTRYGDLDTNAHLNNSAIARLVEEVRVRNLSRLSGPLSFEEARRVMIAHVSIDYLAEGNYPEDVEGGFAISEIGRTSYRLGIGLFQGSRAIAVAECVMVNLGEDRRPGAIGDTLRAELQKLMRQT